MADAQSIRRRAAVAVLSPVLDDTAMMEALWLQHETMRGENVSDIIAFVDAVAQRHMLDMASVKRMYSDFYKAMRESDERLPLDPWPAMQAARATDKTAAPPVAVAAPVATPAIPAAAPVINPVAAALAAAAQAQAATPTEPQEPAVLFGGLMLAVIAEVHRFHREALDEVRKDALRRLDDSLAAPALRQLFRNSWSRPLQHDWQLPGSHGDLAELVRVTYLALTDAFGRSGADQILRRGLEEAEAMPEARQFSPRRLLATVQGSRV